METMDREFSEHKVLLYVVFGGERLGQPGVDGAFEPDPVLVHGPDPDSDPFVMSGLEFALRDQLSDGNDAPDMRGKILADKVRKMSDDQRWDFVRFLVEVIREQEAMEA